MWWGPKYCVALLHVRGDVSRCTLFIFRNFITDNAYLQMLFIIFHMTVCMANYKVYAYVVKHSYRIGGMLFTICEGQLHVSATNVGHLRVVQ